MIETRVIVGAYQDHEGQPATGTVTFTPTNWTAEAATVLTPEPIICVLDEGTVTAELTVPASTTPGGWLWRVVERLDHLPARVWLLDVQTGDTPLLISDVQPVGAVPEPIRAEGPQGKPGEPGRQGDRGPVGPGVPAGGTPGFVLRKSGSADYEGEWSDDGTADILQAVGAVAAEVTAVDQRVTDTNAVLSEVAGMHPVGDGSPLGKVVPQHIGQQYTDRLATNGAVVWISTGLTAASWTVLHGDTGWRDITSLMQVQANWSGVSVKVRRTAEGVWWRIRATAATGATATIAAPGSVPSDWYNPDANVSQVVGGRHGGGSFTSMLIGATGGLALLGTTPPVTSHVCEGLVAAASAWPTTLPGVAALTIEEDAGGDPADAAGRSAAPDRGEA